MNVVCLRGRLVRDVEVRFSTNGNAVANFTMAVNKQTKNDKGEYVFNFRHNAYEEVWSKENASQLVISGGSYISFPIADIIKENEAKIILNWKWYKATEFEFDFSTEEDYEFRYDWKRSGFIQKF
jgi:hypothetical protein